MRIVSERAEGPNLSVQEGFRDICEENIYFLP